MPNRNNNESPIYWIWSDFRMRSFRESPAALLGDLWYVNGINIGVNHIFSRGPSCNKGALLIYCHGQFIYWPKHEKYNRSLSYSLIKALSVAWNWAKRSNVWKLGTFNAGWGVCFGAPVVIKDAFFCSLVNLAIGDLDSIKCHHTSIMVGPLRYIFCMEWKQWDFIRKLLGVPTPQIILIFGRVWLNPPG